MDGRYRTKERWLAGNDGDSDDTVFQPNIYHRVGGNTKVYGAALLRMRSQDFEPVQHEDGVSPAWPLSYEDFESYYSQAEQLYRVRGQQGDDPLEPPRSSRYPFPPLRHEPFIEQLRQQLEQVGLQPFSLPMGIQRNSRQPQNAPCIRCDTCDGYPCLLDAKADAQTCGLSQALQHNNVTLQTEAEVTRLLTDESGQQIRGVEVAIADQSHIIQAHTVVVSCGATNSAALLLRSANPAHPNGLANSSGLVGRNLMKHVVTKLYAFSHRRNPTTFQKTLAVNDFYFGTPNHPQPLGHVHLMGKHKWQMMQPDFPRWMPRSLLKWMADHSVDWWVQTEDLPDPRNRVDLTPQGTIRVHYQPNNLTTHERFKRAFKATLRQAGYPFSIEADVPLQVMNHQAGTCRFGTDPKTSVLDLNCQTHDVNNLYVVDSSFFPSISASNPTLTIVANALRVADQLKHRLGHDTEALQLS